MESRAKIVIIGGGVMGCSLAYHLCKEGQTDVVLLEKAELTSGSTWHAAGQITHSVSHYSLAKMAAYGTELYPRLEDETGQINLIVWKQVAEDYRAALLNARLLGVS